MPCRRRSFASASSVALFPRLRMRAMTAERLTLVKTSDMGDPQATRNLHRSQRTAKRRKRHQTGCRLPAGFKHARPQNVPPPSKWERIAKGRGRIKPGCEGQNLSDICPGTHAASSTSRMGRVRGGGRGRPCASALRTVSSTASHKRV